MKSPHHQFLILAVGALACASTASTFALTPKRTSSPVVITRPINDGSIASHAPFLAARPFDDAKRPDGQAIDAVPPNTPSTTPEPLPAPPPKIAILQPQPSTAPGTSPTGRVMVSVSAPLDAGRVAPSLQASAMAAREEAVSDMENRIRTSETSLAVMRRSTNEMSPEGRAQFHSATAEVNAKEKVLRGSIKAARKANEANWETARTRLAADYTAYAEALARIDVAAGVTPPAR